MTGKRMMPHGFDEKALIAALQELPAELRVAYALLIAERLYPILDAYSREAGGKEASVVRDALDEVWAALERGTLRKQRLTELADAVFEVRPETEDNPSSLSSFALDAAGAAWEAIQTALTGDPSHAVAAAQIGFETVHTFAEEREDFLPQDRADQESVLSRDVVTKELEAQRAQLAYAKGLSANPRAGVAALRREFGYPSRSSIGPP